MKYELAKLLIWVMITVINFQEPVKKRLNVNYVKKDLELKNVLEKWRETLSRILWRSRNEIVIYVLKASKQENTSDSMEINNIIEECSFGRQLHADHKEEVSWTGKFHDYFIMVRFQEQARFVLCLYSFVENLVMKINLSYQGLKRIYCKTHLLQN